MERVDNIKELQDNGIFVFDDFISKKQCNDILFAIGDGLWMDSTVVSKVNNEYIEHPSQIRSSKTIFEFLFSNELKQLINEFQADFVSKLNINPKRLESWQITKYGYEDKFDFHLDCGVKNSAGERDKTILLYLMSPNKGGETFFRALNLYIRPLQGRLVVWNNLLPNGKPNYAMMHAGLPVKQGVKIILNTWTRQFSTIKTKQNETTGKSH